MAKQRDLKRSNIYMSKSIYEFYEAMAADMGITISASMVMGLKFYMDAQKGLSMQNDLKALLQQVQSIEQSNK